MIGSTVTANALSSSGANTGSTLITNTIDDLGRFTLSLESPSQMLELTASGYYRDEITGELSQGTITLRSVIGLSGEQEQTAYINLLTHLTSQRIRNLINDNGMQFDDAKSMAESEFLSTFSDVVPNSSEHEFASLSIYDDGLSGGSSYLLAVSSILYRYALNQSNTNSTNAAAELTLLLNGLEADFGEDGAIDETSTLVSLRAVIPEIDPVMVSNNIDSWISGVNDVERIDINEYLDTDLDGLFNSLDNDDDNDGISDDIDATPHHQSFMVVNQSLEVNEDQPIGIDISTNNPQGTEIFTEIVSPSSNGSVSGAYPTLTYTPEHNFDENDAFSYRLIQGEISSEIVTVNLSIIDENDPPSISGSPITQFMAHNDYSFAPVISDIESDPLEYSIQNLPSWANFNEQTAEISGFPTNDDVGLYENIILSATDGSLTTEHPAFDIEVQLNPYELGFIVENQVLETDEDNSIDIDTTSNNPLGSDITLTITQHPSNGEVIGSYPELTYIPNENFNGTDTLKYQLSQDIIVSGEVTITITITPLNDSPTIFGTAPTQVTAYNEYLFIPSSNDIDNNELVFSITNKPDWLNFSASTGELRGTPSNDNIGEFSNIILEVSDMESSASLPPWNITVEGSIWAPRADIPEGSEFHATAEANGIIYLFGGLRPDYFPTDKTLAYNPETNSWQTMSPMPESLFEITAHHINGLIYVFSGHGGPSGFQNLTLIYNPTTDSWTSGTPMPTTRRGFASSVVDGKVYVIGGSTTDSNDTTNVVEEYDPNRNEWNTMMVAPVSCRNASAGSLLGKIYYLGGQCDSATVSSVHIYDPVTNQWDDGTSMNSSRTAFATSIVNGKLYVMGGNGFLDSVEMYDPDLDSWENKTSMAIPRRGFSSSTFNNKIYVFGGTGTEGRLNSVEMNDPGID